MLVILKFNDSVSKYILQIKIKLGFPVYSDLTKKKEMIVIMLALTFSLFTYTYDFYVYFPEMVKNNSIRTPCKNIKYILYSL